MAAIFIIDQQTIVREAIRHFLFPEHTVVKRTRWPTPQELEGCDLAIIDTATLEQMNGDREESAAVLQRLEIPAIWLYPSDSPMPESTAGGISLEEPLEAVALAKAIDGLLPARTEVRDVAAGSVAGEGVIELTDVVEEELPNEEKD